MYLALNTAEIRTNEGTKVKKQRLISHTVNYIKDLYGSFSHQLNRHWHFDHEQEIHFSSARTGANQKYEWQPPPAVFKQLNDEFMLHLR